MSKAKQHEHADEYKLIDKERGEGKNFDTWQDAQEQLNDMVRLHDDATPEDFEIKPVHTPDGTDKTTKPEIAEFDGGSEVADQTVETIERQPVDQEQTETLPAVTGRMQDPLATLPEWMKTEIPHGDDVSVDLNKRGSQVIANALELTVTAECEVPAEESGFEYCRYRATVETADGHKFNAVGDAHIKESGNNRWDLERLAETRAKKRAVKWSTGGGIKAFLEASDDGE